VIRPSTGCSRAVCRVSEQHLGHPDIDVLFQKIGGKAVSQDVERHALVDLGPIGGGVAGVIETETIGRSRLSGSKSRSRMAGSGNSASPVSSTA
jgi:hypothetical protein